MDTHEIISSGLLELYVAGLTSEEESLQALSYLQQYPEVLAAVREIEGGVEAYAQAHSIAPNKAVKEKIFSLIDAKENVNLFKAIPQSNHKVIQIVSYWKWVAAAAVILLLSSSYFNLLFYQQNHSLDKDLQNLKDELSIAKQGITEMKQDMNVVQSRYSESVRLNGMNETPDAVAKIFWLKNTGEVYIDPSNLPDPPSGKQFQLWAIVDGNPVDAGMIITSKNGSKYHIQKMKTFGKAQAFAITIEKEGGSPTPTMNKMVVMGKL